MLKAISRLFCSVALLPTLSMATAAQDLPPLTADDLQFSVENMDANVDPAVDFYRYASGNWLDRIERPAQLPAWGIWEIMTERLIKQMAAAASKAAADAADAPKGSAVQLVGDFYKSFMDTDAIDAAGIEPIREVLDRVDAIASFEDMTRFMAEMDAIAGPTLFAAFAPANDPLDSSRYALFAAGPTFGIAKDFQDLLGNEDGDPRVPAYRAYIRDMMKVSGSSEIEAKRIADLSLKIEFGLFAGLLTPEEGNDPRNRYQAINNGDVQALSPELDLDLYFETIGYDRPDKVYMYEPHILSAMADVWRQTPLRDLKDYARFRVINNYADFLITEFEEPGKALQIAVLGSYSDRPRQDRIYGHLVGALGHPASQVYVDAYFPDETRTEVLEMIDRIRDVFHKRIETRTWLSETTRAEAIRKVDAFYYKAGYPDTWLDFSSVDIGPDVISNIMTISAFNAERINTQLPLPVEHEEFNGSSTLPISINAGYSPALNGFEVTAAITQPPVYSSDMDAPLRFCRIGAVIGHEMTHGFDSGGRQFDAQGNLRDWWTPEDALAFEAEAQKLIDQANAFEVLPGLNANGVLNVRENMADVGGITLAHQALTEYLEEHPEENVEIDGLSPEQRCFIGWAQLWTMKAAEPYLRSLVASNGHPPSLYRAVAALQHVDAFYEAFDIHEGDPMWLHPERRMNAW